MQATSATLVSTHMGTEHRPSSSISKAPPPAAPAAAAAVDGRAGNGRRITEEELMRLCKEGRVEYAPPPKGRDETEGERTARIRKMSKMREKARNMKKKCEQFLREKMCLRKEEVQSILPAMVERLLEVDNGPVTVGKMHTVATKLISDDRCREDLFADLGERGAGIAEDDAADSFAPVPDDDCDDNFGSTLEESEIPAAGTAARIPDGADSTSNDNSGSQQRYQLRKRKAPPSSYPTAVETMDETIVDRSGTEITEKGYIFEKYCKKSGAWISGTVTDVRRNRQGEYRKCKYQDGSSDSMNLGELRYWHYAVLTFKCAPRAKRRRSLQSQFMDYHLNMYFQHVKRGHSLYRGSDDKHSGHLPDRDLPYIVDEMTVFPQLPYVYNAKLLSRVAHGSELVSKFKDIKDSIKKNNILAVEVDKSQATGGVVRRVKPFDFVINYKESKLMETIKQKAPTFEDDLIDYLIEAADKDKLTKDLQRQDLEYSVNSSEDLQEHVLLGFGQNQDRERADYLEYEKIPIPNLNVKAFSGSPQEAEKEALCGLFRVGKDGKERISRCF